ncbi:MAG: class I SAM-dependent methyltransferase [Deltaproteobacteria bacterium]|nr:MAG: class I SAM-dependent methyltransferase [Deltaproteobacteria bacterium]
MTDHPDDKVHLAFSDKYDRAHAESYFRKHRQGWGRRLSTWREVQVARRALRLAGSPGSVLDLPCGAGRFWPLLMEEGKRTVIGADYSADMLAVARAAYPEFSGRIRTLQTSAFAVDLADEAVACVFCMRLLHHVGGAAARRRLLREFHRVTRETVIVSLWVDGNYKAWRRRRLEARRQARGEADPQNRFVIAREQIEGEFAQAGFDILGRLDFLPGYQMWRTYVLRKR